MRAVLNAIVTISLSFSAAAAFADEPQPRLVTESDTGIVYGDLNCRITSHTASAPRFSTDSFDYLYAQVAIESECVTRSGRRIVMRGQDQVLFPTLTFDWADQAWYIGDTLVATRLDWWRVEVNPDLDFVVWTDEQESHVAFRVEVREQPVP